MTTRYRTRTASSLPKRTMRAHRVLRPVAGQCFEIKITPEPSRWIIRIPEIDAGTDTNSRAAVELAARTCIAERTGIPVGYISVWVRD